MSWADAREPGTFQDECDTLVEAADKPRPPEAEAAARRDRCWLTVLSGASPGAVYRMDGDELVLGRGTTAHARLPLESLSREHARLFRKGESVYVEDLGSANGTFLNGASVLEPRRIVDGDRLELGRSAILRFSLQDALEEQAVMRVYNSSVRDPLIGVYNRLYFEDRLVGEFAFAQRSGSSLSILMIDIDHFKRVNDTYGHPTGDAVLRVVGTMFARVTRKEDVLARYGGEEFVMLARALSPRNAAILGERLRKHTESLRLPVNGNELSVTVSVGVATHCSERNFSSASALVAAADASLYAAKRSGRNRVISD